MSHSSDSLPIPDRGEGTSSSPGHSEYEDRGASIDRPLPAVRQPQPQPVTRPRRGTRLFGKANTAKEADIDEIWNIPVERNLPPPREKHARSKSAIVHLLARSNSKSSTAQTSTVTKRSSKTGSSVLSKADRDQRKLEEDERVALALAPFGLVLSPNHPVKRRTSTSSRHRTSRDDPPEEDMTFAVIQPELPVPQESDESESIERSSYQPESPLPPEEPEEPEESTNGNQFSTPDRRILAELRQGLTARDSQFTMKGPTRIGHSGLGNNIFNAGERHHPFMSTAVPYPRSYSREAVDLYVSIAQPYYTLVTWYCYTGMYGKQCGCKIFAVA